MPVSNSEKALQTYAYLTASLRTDASVADVYDCLIPFLADSIGRRPTEPVSLDTVAADLRDIGLDVPLYALQQMLPRLVERGFVEWNTLARQHIPVIEAIRQQSQFPELPESFAKLEPMLSQYAKGLGVDSPPLSETWSDALISFLRSRYSGKSIKTFVFEDTIIANSPERQEFIVGSFLSNLAENSPAHFQHVVRIYTGIQIEDFISNVQTLQRSIDFNDLLVFYDTAILLRMLGTSGSLHKDATLEMHDSLQSLGAKTYFLGSTSTEVENILNSMVGAYERGQEIFHETSDAILSGEISIGQIRDYAATFEARLAGLNIYPYNYDFATRRNENYFQIDENAFAEALKSSALVAERAYSSQNAHNDAHAVAIVLRLRKGKPARDISRSKVIFVSKNRLLQRVARRFATEHTEFYDDGSIPPVFTEGQITLAAWLGSGKGISHGKVTKELLARCYSAVQPSAEWVDAFAVALAEFQAEKPEAVTERANAIIFLKAARNAAREASLNDASVLKKLNIAEVFRRAEEKASLDRAQQQKREEELERQKAEQITGLQQTHADEIERVRRELDEQHQSLLDEQLQKARIETTKIEVERRRTVRKNTSKSIARLIMFALYSVGVLIGTWTLIFGVDYDQPESWTRYLLLLFASGITALALLDLGGFGVVRNCIDRLRHWIAGKVFLLLGRLNGEIEPAE